MNSANVLGQHERLYRNIVGFVLLRFDADDEDFFTSITRSRIVDFILKRKRFTDETGDEFAFGIERLVNEGVYSAAYPLHDVRGP